MDEKNSIADKNLLYLWQHCIMKYPLENALELSYKIENICLYGRISFGGPSSGKFNHSAFINQSIWLKNHGINLFFYNQSSGTEYWRFFDCSFFGNCCVILILLCTGIESL